MKLKRWGVTKRLLAGTIALTSSGLLALAMPAAAEDSISLPVPGDDPGAVEVVDVPDAVELPDLVFPTDVVVVGAGDDAVAPTSLAPGVAAVKNFTGGAVPVTGTKKVGKTLTVTPKDFTPTPSRYSYQWLRNGNPIGGEKGRAQDYALVAADAGKQISVRVTAKLAGYQDSILTSTPTAVIAKGTFTGGTLPVTGTKKVGKTLTVTPKNFTPTPTNFSYQWLRNGLPIGLNAKESTYELVGADAGKQISVKVTAKATGYEPKVLTSNPTTAISKGTFVYSGGTFSFTPYEDADPRVGGYLMADGVFNWKADFFTPRPSSLTFQWLRDGVPIPGTPEYADFFYIPTSADAGKQISVKFTAKLASYEEMTITSKPISILREFQGGKVTITGTNVIDGLVTATNSDVGKTLTANASGFTPTPSTHAYQWIRMGDAQGTTRWGPGKPLPVVGTDKNYKLTAEDVGKGIYVRVIAQRDGYSEAVVSSR